PRYMAVGRIEEGWNSLNEGLRIALKIHDAEIESDAYSKMGGFHRANGELGEALAAFQASSKAAGRGRHSERESMELGNSAAILQVLGDCPAALAAFEESLAVLPRSAHPDPRARALNGIALCLLNMPADANRRERIESALGESLDLCRHTGLRQREV